jgi:hypothetical protein
MKWTGTTRETMRTRSRVEPTTTTLKTLNVVLIYSLPFCLVKSAVSHEVIAELNTFTKDHLDTVKEQKSDQNPDGTLPRILSGF